MRCPAPIRRTAIPPAWWLPAALAAVVAVGCRAPRASPPGGSDGTIPVTIRFTDVTAAAGIRFRHDHGGSGRKFQPETNGSGVVWFDYDADGWQDLFFVNCKPMPGTPPRPIRHALYRNRGDGTFEDRTPGSGLDTPFYGQGAAAADYDGDGDVDLFVACLGPNHLFRNDGNGHFTDVTQQAGLATREPYRYHSGAAWLDYDRDGDLDLFVARYVRWTPATDPFCGSPGMKRYCPPWNMPRERSLLYRNQGNGRFADVSRETGVDRVEGHWFQPLVLDYDGDGWLDVAVTSDGTPMALFRNEQGRRFRDVAAATSLGVTEPGSWKGQMGIDGADWRNDGREAILIGNFSGQRLSLFEMEAPDLYTDTVDRVGMGESSLLFLTFGLAFLDADRDGWRDAFIANGHIDDYIELFESNVTYAQRPLFYRNDRGRRFVEIGSQVGFTERLIARGCAVADYDRDGDLDLVVTQNNGPARLYRNDSPSPHHWLRVELRGPAPNRHAVGARVVVEAGGLRQTQWVRAGGHYYSQSEFPLLFGLASAREATVTVTWPDGTQTTRSRCPAGTTVTIARE